MKKIVEGKLYNTDTAKEIGSIFHGDNYGDFSHYSETLYKKRTGEYFLHGEGGPMSRYAVSVSQNSWSGGEKIIPLVYENARKWAEEHLNADDYEEEFGEVSEGGESMLITLSLDEGTIAKAKRAAQQKSMSLSAYIASLINQN